MRLAVGGMTHETNSYATAGLGPTGLEHFTQRRGSAILDAVAGTRTPLGGMLAAADGLGLTVVPTFSAHAEPSGTITRRAYRTLRDTLLDALRHALPLDAVALDLHGAAAADGLDDCEGDLLAAVRGVVGPGVPVGATLDLHGNVTDDMAAQADLLLGVHFYPHTDGFERGEELVGWLTRQHAGALRPVTHVERLPALLPLGTTDRPPLSDVNERCWAVEQRTGVIDCTFFHGFAFTDSPLAAMRVVVTTDGDRRAARAAARAVAAGVWNDRHALRPRTVSCAEAARLAAEATDGPVVIADSGDNPGGGAPGDGTHLLRALLDEGLDRSAFGCVWDPEVAALCHARGEGAHVAVRLGGKTDRLHGAPIEAEADVVRLTDGRFRIESAMGAGSEADLGPAARLRIGGVDVLVASRRAQVFDPAVFRLHDVDVTACRAVGVKSRQHFRAGFGGVAARVLLADSPGLTGYDIARLPHRRLSRPLWPLDAGARYDPAG